jgi:putative acetyltransferase
VIRPFRDSDLAEAVALFTESVHGLASNHYDEHQLTTWAPRTQDLDRWRTRLSSVSTLVADTDKTRELTGFISYERNGHVDLLYVSPAHIRRGYASALYKEAEAILRREGVEQLFSEVSLNARPFFEHHGFRAIQQQVVESRGMRLARFEMLKALKP